MVINQLLQLNLGRKAQMIAYADDLAIHGGPIREDILYKQMTTALKMMETKAMQLGLKFSPDKCEALLCRSNHPDWNFKIAGEEIPWRASVKYLGVIIDLPTEWTQANVAPIFKKGSKLQAVNYRPVSLTCITCKLFEHIICKHILAHLEDHKILTDLQHGFRSGRSCETQLVTTFQDLAQMHNKKGSQIDIAVLDFSKAFATVPHDGILSKLKHYGIDEKIWLWIYNFLRNRKQSVVVDGKQSSLIDVVSGVTQGTVLGPLLFLLHINVLPSVVSSKVRLFADDCLIYRNIKNKEDQIALQKDLNLLENWGNTWGMRFNAAKCNIVRVSRTRDPKLFNYSLTGQVLEEVMDA